jgi:hypothetical protein
MLRTPLSIHTNPPSCLHFGNGFWKHHSELDQIIDSAVPPLVEVHTSTQSSPMRSADKEVDSPKVQPRTAARSSARTAVLIASVVDERSRRADTQEGLDPLPSDRGPRASVSYALYLWRYVCPPGCAASGSWGSSAHSLPRWGHQFRSESALPSRRSVDECS